MPSAKIGRKIFEKIAEKRAIYFRPWKILLQALNVNSCFQKKTLLAGHKKRLYIEG